MVLVVSGVSIRRWIVNNDELVVLKTDTTITLSSRCVCLSSSTTVYLPLCSAMLLQFLPTLSNRIITFWWTVYFATMLLLGDLYNLSKILQRLIMLYCHNQQSRMEALLLPKWLYKNKIEWNQISRLWNTMDTQCN